MVTFVNEVEAMRRREFITLIGGMTVVPLIARARQMSVPVVGLSGATTARSNTPLLSTSRRPGSLLFGRADEAIEEAPHARFWGLGGLSRRAVQCSLWGKADMPIATGNGRL